MEGEILFGKNGGKEWRLTTSEKRFDRPLYNIFFIDSLKGWIVGRGKTFYHTGKKPLIKEPYQVLFTKNGGKSWETKNVYLPISLGLFSVYFIDSLTGWIVGEAGTILHTKNGGEKWFHLMSPFSDNLRSVEFLNKDTGIIVGEDGLIIFTKDGGQTWFWERVNEKVDLNDIEFTNKNIVWVIGEKGTILKGEIKF